MDEIQKGWRNLSHRITATRRRVEESIGSQIRDLNQARQSRKNRGRAVAPVEQSRVQESLPRPPKPPPKDTRSASTSRMERRSNIARYPAPTPTGLDTGSVRFQNDGDQEVRPHTSGGCQTTPVARWGQDSRQLRRASSAKRAPQSLSERPFLPTVVELPHMEDRGHRRPSTANGPVTQTEGSSSMVSRMRHPRRPPSVPDLARRVAPRASGGSRNQKLKTPESAGVHPAFKNDSMFTTRQKGLAECTGLGDDRAIPFAFAKRTEAKQSMASTAHLVPERGYNTCAIGAPSVAQHARSPALVPRNDARVGGPWDRSPADEDVHSFGSDVFDHDVRPSSQRHASSLFDEISQMLMVDTIGNGAGNGAMDVRSTHLTERAGVQNPFSNEASSSCSVASHAAFSSLDDDWEDSALFRRKGEPEHAARDGREASDQTRRMADTLAPSPLRPQPSRNGVSIHRLSKFTLPLRESDWPHQWVPPAPSLVSLGPTEMAEEYDEEWHAAHLNDEVEKLRGLRPRLPDEQGDVRHRRQKSFVTDPRVGVSFHSSLRREPGGCS